MIFFKKTFKLLKHFIKYIKLFIIYFPFLNFIKTKQKEIIIVFDGNFGHGGLVDRLKGIVSFYAISKEINADFKIYFKHPFQLDTFLEPNQYNWLATDSDLNWNPFQTKFLFLMDNFSFNWKKTIQKSNKQKFIVYANIDYLNTIYTDLDSETLKTKWSALFQELFKKTILLQNAMNNLNLPSEYLAIHTRFTSLLGDFQDTTIRSISEERKKEILYLLKAEIEQIETDLSKIVFSDSIIFLNYIKENLDVMVLEGNPSHIDVKNSGIADDNLKTFVDFFVISNAKRIYLLRTKEMYNSAFSKYASFISNREFYNFLLHENK